MPGQMWGVGYVGDSGVTTGNRAQDAWAEQQARDRAIAQQIALATPSGYKTSTITGSLVKKDKKDSDSGMSLAEGIDLGFNTAEQAAGLAAQIMPFFQKQPNVIYQRAPSYGGGMSPVVMLGGLVVAAVIGVIAIKALK